MRGRLAESCSGRIQSLSRTLAAVVLALLVFETLLRPISSAVALLIDGTAPRLLLTFHDLVFLSLALFCTVRAPSWIQLLASQPVRGFARGILLAAPFVAVIWLGVLMNGEFSLFPRQLSADRFWLLCAGAALYVALAEELLLRGALQSYLEKKVSLKATVWIQGALFVTLHIPGYQFNVLQSAFMFAGGALLTLIFLRWRSLWTVIGVHFTWNLSAFALYGFSIRENFVVGVVQPERFGLVAFFYAMAVLLALMMLATSKRVQSLLYGSPSTN